MTTAYGPDGFALGGPPTNSPAFRGAPVDDAQTQTLAEFLLARYAEDEAASREAASADGGSWWVDGPAERSGKWWVYATGEKFEREATARHIARHDPARVIAECEAHRRIVEDYGREWWPDAGNDRDLKGCGDSAISAAWTLRHLALPYADHPDYREEWKP